jgi:hypothetical protein
MRPETDPPQIDDTHRAEVARQIQKVIQYLDEEIARLEQETDLKRDTSREDDADRDAPSPH